MAAVNGCTGFESETTTGRSYKRILPRTCRFLWLPLFPLNSSDFARACTSKKNPFSLLNHTIFFFFFFQSFDFTQQWFPLFLMFLSPSSFHCLCDSGDSFLFFGSRYFLNVFFLWLVSRIKEERGEDDCVVEVKLFWSLKRIILYVFLNNARFLSVHFGIFKFWKRIIFVLYVAYFSYLLVEYYYKFNHILNIEILKNFERFIHRYYS